MSVNFYKNLPAFTDFEQFSKESNYQSLPEDWFVYITDIVNSSAAIDEGLYKEVNLIGAASITLCINLLKDITFPFVFGGDGASLCIPSNKTAIVDMDLARLINLAKHNFDLDLRVGKISVTEIQASGKQALVSKFELTPGSTLAFFRGGGLEHAEQVIKKRYEKYAIAPSQRSVEELTGLSCRWSPIPAQKATIVSLIIKARSGNTEEVYAALIQKIRQVLGNSLDEANPVDLRTVKYKSFFKALKEETLFHRSKLSMSFVFRVIGITFSILIFRFGINPFFFSFNSKTYKDSIRHHSDYRKFDDTLRLILDCHEEELEGLKECLEKSFQEEKIYYGLFSSRQALMTCFVHNLQQGNHLHFIDGADGGLAMAARQLKTQMKS